MANKLNPQHKRFIRYRVSGLSRTDAYMKAYNITDGDPDKLSEKRRSAQRNASRLVNTFEYIREEIIRRMDESTEEAQETFSLEMAGAADTVAEIMRSGTKNDGVRLRAAEYIVDRGLGKPRTDVNLEGAITGDLNIKLELPEEIDVDKLL
jgi:hypothetical protein